MLSSIYRRGNDVAFQRTSVACVDRNGGSIRSAVINRTVMRDWAGDSTVCVAAPTVMVDDVARCG